MAIISQQNLDMERFELPRNEAVALMKEMDEPYKVELIEDLADDAVISFYRQGGVCRPVRGAACGEHGQG